MFSQYDELELLALIEGDLDPAAEGSLRDRLSADPAAVEVLEAMIRDRALLRSEEEPVMPADLSSRIEHVLTRPMLIAAWGEDEVESPGGGMATMTARPGAFRRRHNRLMRPMRIRRAVRFAMAASVGLLLIGGLWAGVNFAINFVNDRDVLIAQSDADSLEVAGRRERLARTAEPWPPAGSSVHHYAPHPVLEAYLARETSGLMREGEPAAGEPVAVEFALVLSGVHASEAESRLAEMIAARSMHAALVENFDYDEAIRQEGDRLVAGGDPRRPVGPPHLSDGRTAAQHQPSTRHLAGQRNIAVSVQQQMEYASRGATHTITIRLSELHAFLEEIERSSIALGSSLRPLFQRAADEDGADEVDDLWPASLAAVREAITALEETGGDPLIHLPIVIE